MTAVDTPHFAFPFHRQPNGKVAVVEQGSEAHVMSCCLMIAYCPLGFRPERPDFGWHFPTFSTAPLDLTTLRTAIETFEPRANVEDMTQWADIANAAVEHVNVQLQIQEDETGGN